MELFLNLAWLLLAMPAFWLWHYSRTAPDRRRSTPLQCLLALGCMLVILFPVISATDDLRAMRAEMEEPSTKKSIRQATGEKPCSSKSQAHPALPSALTSCPTGEVAWYLSPTSVSSGFSVPLLLKTGRSPPLPSRA